MHSLDTPPRATVYRFVIPSGAILFGGPGKVGSVGLFASWQYGSKRGL